MTLVLYGHPFASSAWKPLIALYEREIPFEFRMVDPGHPENGARLATISPTGQFPALVDGDTEISQSMAIVAYCDLLGEAPPLVPEHPREAVRARMMAAVFDDYIHAPMQKIVADALRPPEDKDARGVADAKAMLDRCYAWLEARWQAEAWACGNRFTVADCAAAPALFYADWVHPIGESHPTVRAYRARLLAHVSVARVVDEARPFRAYFPLGAPDRD